MDAIINHSTKPFKTMKLSQKKGKKQKMLWNIFFQLQNFKSSIQARSTPQSKSLQKESQ